jgi:hypothetical protein
MELATLIAFVAASALWVGAVAWTTVHGARVRAREDADAVVGWGARHARITRWVAVPAALAALATGIAGVRERDLGIDPHWWIGTGIAAWVVCFLGSTLPRGKALSRAVAQAGTEGAQSEDVRWQLRQVSFVARGELLLLVVALVVIALTPTTTLG